MSIFLSCRKACALLFIAACFVPAAAQAQDNAKSRLNEIQKRGVLRVGMTGDYFPMTFRDPGSNEFKGHQVDAANELATDLGVKVEFVPTDWKTMITGLQSDKYDIAMSGTSMSLARAKVVAMVDSWGMNAFVPVALKKNAEQFKSWDDLNKKERSVAVNLGTTMEDYIKAELPRAEMKRIESPATGWQEVLAGRADFTMTTLIEGSGLQQRYPELTMVLPNQARSALPMTFLITQGDPIWLNYLNSWVYLKKTSGYFDTLARKWNVVVKQ